MQSIVLTQETSELTEKEITYFLSKVTLNLVDENFNDEVERFLGALVGKEKNQSLTHFEHLFLTAVLFHSFPLGAIRGEVENLYARSWKAITGSELPGKGANRLPNRVLKKLPRRFRAYHAAVFLKEPLQRDYDLRKLFQDIVIEDRDIILGAMILLLCCHPVGFQIVAGCLVGLLGFASFNEMLTHRHVGHHEEKEQRIFDRLGAFGRSLEYVSLAHKLHHIKVKVDFGVSFRDEQHKEKVDAIADRCFVDLLAKRESVADKEAARLRMTGIFRGAGYGVNATWLGSLYMLVAAIPGYVLIGVLGNYLHLPYFIWSCVVSGTFFILQSLHSHRYLHMNKTEVESGQHETTRFMRWYLKTRPAQFQQRLHFVHHQYGMYEAYNDVIMMGSGGDWLLGKVKAPNCRDLYLMDLQHFMDYE